ncbi:LuxR C-terminal-related transcriptional regulator [Micromonospora sp. NPDC048830]|uniref:helix-turn-helix transcriptional regulator n=1 Tax=Micromonospora sp. NPDC048830 TaxID=3364257 RepID=UPI00370FA7A5
MTALQDLLPPEERAELRRLADGEAEGLLPLPVATGTAGHPSQSLQSGDADPVITSDIDNLPSDAMSPKNAPDPALVGKPQAPTTSLAQRPPADNTRRRRPEGETVLPEQPQPEARPHEPMRRVPVTLISADVISRMGVIGQLRPRPEVLLLDDTEADQAQATLVIADSVDEPTLRALRALRIRKAPGLVLVVTHVDDAGLAAAVEHGVLGLVRRAEASPERLVTAIRAAAAGEGSIPADLLGRLLQQVGALQRDTLGPRGMTILRLAGREAAVLRLVADGYDTAEIAAKLRYSPRTIKNILYDVTNRFHLRNRCHAVAYALRNGLI